MGSSPSKTSPYAENRRQTLRQTNFVNRNNNSVRPSPRRVPAAKDDMNMDNKFLHQNATPRPPPAAKTTTSVERIQKDAPRTQPKTSTKPQENNEKDTYQTLNGKVKTNATSNSNPPKKAVGAPEKKTKKKQNTVRIAVDAVDSKKKPGTANDNNKPAVSKFSSPQPTPRKSIVTPRQDAKRQRTTVPESRGYSAAHDSYVIHEEHDEYEEYEEEEEEEAGRTEHHSLTGKEKIETHLRSSRVPETKVRSLAVRISEQTKKDQMHTPREPNSDLTKTLRKVIHKNFDVMLYGVSKKTKLCNTEDEKELVQKVSEMAELLESDLTTCMESARRYSDAEEKSAHGKSMPVLIQGAMQQLKTDYEILLQENEQLREEKEEAEGANVVSKHKTQAAQESSFQLEFQHQKLKADHQRLREHASVLEAEERTLKLTVQDLEQENAKLQKQVHSLEESNRTLARELEKSQDACAHLTVQVADQAKEISRLKDPDPQLVYRIQTLQTELTESTTTNRKMELEKGAIKSSLQKLQASYNAMLKERGILSKENQKLQKENDLVKTTNKKLVLASRILR